MFKGRVLLFKSSTDVASPSGHLVHLASGGIVLIMYCLTFFHGEMLITH